VRELLRSGAPSTAALVKSARKIGLSADKATTGIVVRVPIGWGLINPPKPATRK